MNRNVAAWSPWPADHTVPAGNTAASCTPTGNLVEFIRLQLAATQGSSTPTLAQLASLAAMSERTLRRRLQQHRTSYNQLLRSHREAIARSLLADATVLIEDIAEQAGYSEAANFRQAFKRWQGCAPSHYRQALTS